MDNVTLITLISEQVIPSVLPVYHIQGVARLVHLITHDSFQVASARIARFYLQKTHDLSGGTSFDDHDISVENVYVQYNDWRSTYEVLIRLYENHPTLIVNLTGGTKLMAIGAYRAALEKQIPAFYIDSGSNQWVWVIPASVSEYFHVERMSGEMAVKELVELHGGKIRHDMQKIKGYDENLYRIAKHIAEDYLMIQGMISFNHEKVYRREILGSNASEVKIRVSWGKPKSNSQDLLHESLFINLVNRFKEQGFFTAVDQYATRTFLISMRPNVFELLKKQGNWLEYYVYSLLSREKSQRGIYDLEMGITIEWEGHDSKTVNEADVVVSWHRQLYFISCKTGKVREGIGTMALDQLVSVAPRIGGLFTRKILVTIHEISDDMKARAELLKIHTVTLKELLGAQNPVTLLLGMKEA